MNASSPTKLSLASKPNLLQSGTAGKAHGTFGELLQGALPGSDNHFLVTLPIHRFSYATFYRNAHSQTVIVTPKHKTKSRDLAHCMLQRLAPGMGGSLVLRGDLEEGKGFASSSADMVATARAITAAFGVPLDLDLLLCCMGDLEPTDGVMFDSCLVFFHRSVKPGQELGPPPSIRILGIDEGGIINTVHFNHNLMPYTEAETLVYQDLLAQLHQSFHNQDLDLLGAVCTRGALLSQKRNPKTQMSVVLQIADQYKALGVVVTHSGTCLGIMLSHYDNDFEQKEAAITASLTALGHAVLPVDSLSYNKQGAKPW